ncbi:zinc finger protein Xfin-like isoform X3 [Harmonia axyridis]|uniref:zinc finger protein Xfin-like isoform X3 n=2 Tax=Harmonia axyridis TaxID=115357 RepID=UPI001E277D2E|nr:zinc finger protein Xfin-like isoform X3 [Harmonia axyridis]
MSLKGSRPSMSVPSMVHRLGDTLVVRSVVSGNELYAGNSEKGKSPLQFSEKELPDLPDCKVKRNYSCSSCEYFTQNPRHYLYHLRDVHNEKVRIYECPNCLYASKHFQKLLRHSRMVHGSSKTSEIETKVKKPPQPPVTAEEDDTSEVSDNEESEPSKPMIFKCSVCAFAAKSRMLLTKHEKEEHIKTKFFRCTKCTYVTHMKARFTKHVKYHSMPMIKCDTCDFRTPYKWNLDRHCKNHNGKGAFRCSACNFTADIKQSLTVHEMNHHVPPVGQAAGFGIGRRRNKVGASDTAAAEEAALMGKNVISQVTQIDEDKPKPLKNKTKVNTVSVKKPKTSKNLSDFNQAPSPFGSDFINPDDIIHHANGNVYFKNKCKLCNFKSAWDSEMTKHEAKIHNIVKEQPVKVKKAQRPVPNLIPINMHKIHRPSPPENPEPVMTQKDFNDICAKSTNSALKDFASLMDGENIFNLNNYQSSPTSSRVPDLIPASTLLSPKNTSSFKRKNASFFDQLKEKLMTSCGDVNLNCKYCGHKSKCLSEQVKHQKSCGTETSQATSRLNVFTSSSRCQYCRQRCKSSVDLYNHLQTCLEAQKSLNKLAQQEGDNYGEEFGVKIEPSDFRIKEEDVNDDEDFATKKHPMEHRVFVWNNIEVPMDIDVDDSIYEYTEDRASDSMYIHEDKVEDNMSLDLSIRTHSPVTSESSFMETDAATALQQQSHSVPEKIPTHGTDISVAQHKRVFQCPHCTFWASTASRFHVHIVGHLNKKPFECSLCSYRSNWRWDITKHIKLKSVRDPAHESAKVLMTDETGRRNYTKYNKYLTEIHVSVDQSLDTSGGSGTRPKGQGTPKHETTKPSKIPPITADFNSVLQNTSMKTSPKMTNENMFSKLTEKKKSSNENKRTLFKCKKCNFRHASRDVLLQHVKGHYTATSSGNSSLEIGLGRSDVGKDERHCRLKHGGDIRVVSSKNGQERLVIEEQTDEPDHIDMVQTGTFKCKSCPFSNDNHAEFEEHLEGHISKPDTVKCHYCNYYVSKKEDLVVHLALHGVSDPEDFLQRMSDHEDVGKRFRCLICPYVTNSKSQYTYHKQFHKPRGGQYSCTQCSYNVSKRHLLHQHLKVHGINVTPHRQNGEAIDMDEVSEEIEEVPSCSSPMDLQSFPDIPLVWVSKNGKFTKMFKCRYCPHVNLRKVNIQEHEKMHSVREKNPNSKGSAEVEHHCNECNYVCNNAGVLSSHSKVHQGLSGTVHCLVDPSKTDEEQISELSRIFNNPNFEIASGDDFEGTDLNLSIEEPSDSSETTQVLHFCSECPARFLKENEYLIHTRFHGVRLFYKCEYCSYTSRQKPHLLAHNLIHSTEYQERTKVLQEIHPTSAKYKQPQIFQVTPNRSEPVWVVFNRTIKTEPTTATSNKPKGVNVPLSGTDLFQQKFEAEQKCSAAEVSAKIEEPQPSAQKFDRQFGILMHGNPNFIYPTTVKNGKMKEKRYKCPTCPSAFEKRDQYKIHLSLHGSKQRYNCDTCDYSVKYYANYVQHKKKHTLNEKAQADKNASSDHTDENEDEIEEGYLPYYEEIDNIEALNETIEPIENLSCSKIKEHLEEKKRTFYCHLCPFADNKKEVVNDHLRRHTSFSGITNNHTCEICDYSVPQISFLKDHLELHAVPAKTEENIEDSEENQSISPNGDTSDIPERFNNNEGENEYLDSEDNKDIFSKNETEN